MDGLIKEQIKDADSTEEYLTKAFSRSEYTLKDLDEEDIRVQNAQAPAQLIVRGNGRVLDDEQNEIIEDKEIYARLLLDEVDDGVVVWVKEP